MKSAVAFIAFLIGAILAFVGAAVYLKQWNPLKWKTKACAVCPPPCTPMDFLFEPKNVPVRDTILAVSHTDCNNGTVNKIEVQEFAPVHQNIKIYKRKSDGTFLRRTGTNFAQFARIDGLPNALANDEFHWKVDNAGIPTSDGNTVSGSYDTIPGTNEPAFHTRVRLSNATKNFVNKWIAFGHDCTLDDFVMVDYNVPDDGLLIDRYQRATTIAPHDADGLVWHNSAFDVLSTTA
jgi:hypothetical protein